MGTPRLWVWIINAGFVVTAIMIPDWSIYLMLGLAVFNLALAERTRQDVDRRFRLESERTRKIQTQQERNLSMQSRQLETIVEHIPFPIGLMDPQGRIVLLNDAFKALADRAVTQPLFDDPGFDAEIRVFIRNAYLREAPIVKGFNHKERDYQGLSVPVYDQGRYAGCLLMFIEVTQLLDGERSQKRFIADASHELRTPLSTILGMVEILNRPEFDDDAIRNEFLDQIEHEARRMERMIVDLLTLSKMSASRILLNPVRIPLLSFLDELRRTLRPTFESKGNRLQLDVSADHWVTADPDKLTQILTNLLINANTFTDEGVIKVVTRIETEWVRIDVLDTGIGIDPADQPYLFERFYRSDKSRSRQTGGSGLGLAIVKNLVLAHKGEVSVQSTLGAGSTFTVRLPRQ